MKTLDLPLGSKLDGGWHMAYGVYGHTNTVTPLHSNYNDEGDTTTSGSGNINDMIRRHLITIFCNSSPLQVNTNNTYELLLMLLPACLHFHCGWLLTYHIAIADKTRQRAY